MSMKCYHKIAFVWFMRSGECGYLSINYWHLTCQSVVCPLKFEDPSTVIKDCRDLAAPNPSCCTSLNAYIATVQKQMLITNKQAINCATLFGSMLQKGGVMTNIYELCDVDLKDFSLQGMFRIIWPLLLFSFNIFFLHEPDTVFCTLLLL